MDFLKKLSSDATDKPEDQNPDHHKTSASDLLSSAKLVADAAKSSFGGGSDSVDKGKVAGATADLLGAASDYGKLDQTKGFGMYVEKAENYLHEYEGSHSAPHGSGSEPTKAEEPPKKENAAEKKDGGFEGGGFSEMAEMAGFLKK